MNITLTDRQIEKMNLNEVRSRLASAHDRRDMLLKRRGELDGWLVEAKDHIQRLTIAKTQKTPKTDTSDNAKPKASGRICTNWYACPKCHARRDPDPRGQCPECGIKMVVKSSGDW